jgi:hypothetical protein
MKKGGWVAHTFQKVMTMPGCSLLFPHFLSYQPFKITGNCQRKLHFFFPSFHFSKIQEALGITFDIVLVVVVIRFGPAEGSWQNN